MKPSRHDSQAGNKNTISIILYRASLHKFQFLFFLILPKIHHFNFTFYPASPLVTFVIGIYIFQSSTLLAHQIIYDFSCQHTIRICICEIGIEPLENIRFNVN